MIPILYDSSETAFTSNGLGRLTECTSCRVTEVRNGEYECEFSYPITGRLYDQIKEGMIISCTHDDRGDRQPFTIYRHSAPIGGLVVFNAHHKSYELNDYVLDPIEAVSAADAFAQIETSTTPANPYTMWTDVTTAGTFKTEVPKSVRSSLGGSAGSVLDIFGGEYEWDGTTVKLHAHRGNNSGATIRYGKNLTDLTQTYDVLGTYDAIVPYWYAEEEGLVILPEKYVARQGVENPRIAVIDFSQDFESKPDAGTLREKAVAYLTSNTPWVPKENIKIKFVQLWQTEEYKDVAVLQRLHLCDRVNVFYPELGVEVDNVEIIKVVYNVLLDRYDEMELGSARSTLAETIISPVEGDIDTVKQDMATKSFMQKAIDHATKLITGGMGGNVVFRYDGDGFPIEILIMDTKEVETAQHVLRINLNGIGFSHDGINGPYTSAWTLDGQFVADFITAGTMSANRIRGGTLQLGGADNGNGVLIVYDASGNEIGRWDKDGAQITGNLILSNDDITAKISDVFGYVFGKSGSQNYIEKTEAHAFRINGESWGQSTASVRGRSNSFAFTASDMFELFKIASKTAIEDFSNCQGDRMVVAKDSTKKYSFLTESSSPGEYVICNMTYDLLENDFNDDETYERKYVTVKPNQTFFMLENCFGICSGGLRATGSSGATGYIGTSYGLQATSLSSYFYISPDYGGIAMQCNDGSGGSGSVIASVTIKGDFQIRSGASLRVYDNYEVDISGDMEVISGGTTPTIKVKSTATGWWSYVEWQSSSSRRYKHDIKAIEDDALDPHRLYELEVKQFIYNDNAALQYADMKDQLIPGFIAEEVAEIYPSAVIHNQEDQATIESWDERRILPPMLALIQEQKKEIDALTERIEKLEALIEKLTKE